MLHVLQTTISIVFIYLILALITSELQEYLATISEARAKRLKQSIRQMLGEENLRQQEQGNCKLCYSTGIEGKSNWTDYFSLQDEDSVAKLLGLQRYHGNEVLEMNTKCYTDERGDIHRVQDVASIYTREETEWVSIKEGRELTQAERDQPGQQKAEYRVYVYKIDKELSTEDKGRYYINGKNEMQNPLRVQSLTEKIYLHPDIQALNQSAFKWLPILGLDFSRYPSNLKKWIKEDWLNLLSTIILILFVCNPFPKIGIMFSIALFLSYLAIRLGVLMHLKANPRDPGMSRISVGPSYIDNESLFARALVDVLTNESGQQDMSNKNQIKNIIKSLSFYSPAQSYLLDRVIKMAGEDIASFQSDIQQVFAEVQRRSSGVYKRNAKGLSLLVGLFVAFTANADTFNMISQLSKTDNQSVKGLVGALETQFASSCTKNPDLPECKDLKANQDALRKIFEESTGLPLGWDTVSKDDSSIAMTTYTQSYELRNELKKFLEKNCADKADKADKAENCNAVSLAESFRPDQLNSTSRSKLQGLILLKDGDNAFKSKLTDTIKSLGNDSLVEYQKLVSTTTAPAAPATLEGMKKSISTKIAQQGGGLRVAFGWLITAIALSMGAPFWFDLLSRIMNVRNSAKSLTPAEDTQTSSGR